MCYFDVCFLVFFFKQKTAYEMRISDWSSDVCSSDLADVPWQTSLRLASALESADVEVTLVKGAAHRLSEPEDLARLEHTVEGLAQRAAARMASSPTR